MSFATGQAHSVRGQIGSFATGQCREWCMTWPLDCFATGQARDATQVGRWMRRGDFATGMRRIQRRL
jgi:hypothetical protein